MALTMANSIESLMKRVYIAVTASTTPAEQAEMQRDPFLKSKKYGYGFTYFAIILLVATSLIRLYHIWGDKMRIALYREHLSDESPSIDFGTSSLQKHESLLHKVLPLHQIIALMRWIFYRPIPSLNIGKTEVVFPSLSVTAIVLLAVVFVTLYCFLPQPLYYWSISLGSPPLAIRAGMLAAAMIPWIVALSTKANFITMFTGLSPERLKGLHRWSAYICLFLSLVHIIPFYITTVWTDGAEVNYRNFINQGIYVYGTGWAAAVPLFVLCIHSLPFLRNRLYELFVIIHIPVSWVFLAMLLWHTKNWLQSWGYLWTTNAIWILSYLIRLWYLNWMNPFWTSSFMIGEESAVTLLPKGAIKVTVPTRMRWRPGQYVYLRMPGVAVLDNHPFTISSLCSDDFPSAYGESYRDLTLVFRPFQGFTRKVLREALKNGPLKIYTAFLEGPYGGMQREMAAFDDVVFFAGGSGITAIASQLLDLIKKIRDGKAIIKSIKVVWALRDPETMSWFQEELRICRDNAPADIMQCHFFLTGLEQNNQSERDVVQEKIYKMLQRIDKKNATYIQEETAGDNTRETELHHENENGITALPIAYNPRMNSSIQPAYLPSPGFDFEFTGPKRLTPRYASFQPSKINNWRTDYFRPNIPDIINEYSKTFGRRACVFVCGPPSMRVEVANTVAKLQMQVLTDQSRDEIFLHAENYNN